MNHPPNPFAFPSDPDWCEDPGMHLRDYFAAHALQGILAGKMLGCTDHVQASAWCYQYADQMLKARVGAD